MKNKHLIDSHDSTGKSLVKTSVFDILITNATMSDVLEFVSKSIEENRKPYYIVTPNPEMIVYASKHNEFRQILNRAQIALCDGMQLFRAAAFVGKPLKERITGVQLMESLCQSVSEKPITVGFLGGRDGVAKMAADRLSQKYPDLNVVFVGEEPEELRDFHVTIDNEKLKRLAGHKNFVTRLNNKKQKHIDILFVAFGFPKQEEWMFKNLSKIDVSVMMSVGGAFDYVSGRVSRAPQWVQHAGFEWLYRLIRQPWRWRRQLALFEFLLLVLKEKMKNNSSVHTK